MRLSERVVWITRAQVDHDFTIAKCTFRPSDPQRFCQGLTVPYTQHVTLGEIYFSCTVTVHCSLIVWMLNLASKICSWFYSKVCIYLTKPRNLSTRWRPTRTKLKADGHSTNRLQNGVAEWSMYGLPWPDSGTFEALSDAVSARQSHSSVSPVLESCSVVL